MDKEKIKEIIKHETENKCKGNSIHECVDCGEPFFCYACPNDMNHSYVQTMCRPCLKEIFGYKENLE